MEFKCNECKTEDTLSKEEALDEGWKKKGKKWICPDCIDDYEVDKDEEDEDDDEDDDDDDFSSGGIFGGLGGGFGGGGFGGASFGGGGGRG